MGKTGWFVSAMHKRTMTAFSLLTMTLLLGCPKKEEAKAPPVAEKKAEAKPAEAKKAEAPEHYFNKKENLDPDPAYVPGDYPAPDTAAAKKAYEERAAKIAVGGDKTLKVQEGGELTFGIAKNEQKRVFGYFRKYAGAVALGASGPEKVELVIDVNSIDTAVAGRDHRIMDILLQSMKPEYGTAVLVFDKFDMGGKSWDDAVKEGAPIVASGSLTVNDKSNPVKTKLSVTQEGDVYTVETTDKVLIKLSDYGYGERPYALMKACNHVSMGNVVDLAVNVKLK